MGGVVRSLWVLAVGGSLPRPNGFDVLRHERIVIFVIVDEAIHRRGPFGLCVFRECLATGPAFD